jgi:hypothetical protein
MADKEIAQIHCFTPADTLEILPRGDQATKRPQKNTENRGFTQKKIPKQRHIGTEIRRFFTAYRS